MSEDPTGDPAEIPANLLAMGDGMIRFTAGGLDPDTPGLHAQHIHRFPDGGRIEIDYYRDEGPYTDNATWYVASAGSERKSRQRAERQCRHHRFGCARNPTAPRPVVPPRARASQPAAEGRSGTAGAGFGRQVVSRFALIRSARRCPVSCRSGARFRAQSHQRRRRPLSARWRGGGDAARLHRNTENRTEGLLTMLEHRPTEPKPNPWPGVILYLSTLALIAWFLWLLLGR